VKRGNDALDAVRQASARSALLVHIEMKRGLNGLASIAATAPLVGFFGTVFGAIGSFKGLGTERSTGLISIAKDLSESLVPTVLGLLVGVLAFSCYRYLVGRLENFDIEMKNASLEVIDELALL